MTDQEADIDPELAEIAADLAIKTIEITFARSGLEFARLISGGDAAPSLSTIADCLNDAFDELQTPLDNRPVLGDAVMGGLREALYSSTPDERRFFQRLAKTYALMFALQLEPRVIEFFEEMHSDFVLYVGADVLIRALSERYVADADQMTRNTLRAAIASGARLVLTEPILTEVVSHLRATDREFTTHVQGSEGAMTFDLARQGSRILIRSYLYATMLGSPKGSPKSWEGYVNQFCDYKDLHKPGAFNELRQYLQAELGLDYEDERTLLRTVDEVELANLSTALLEIKVNAELARNDALMVLAVYGKREALGEHRKQTVFGYRTWWLTEESRIVQKTRVLVNARKGERYLMRPEFLLNFLALSPTAAEGRRALDSMFPSIHAVRLASRVDETEFHRLMDQVREANELEPARRSAAIAKMTNELKGDLRRQFVHPGNKSPST
jgi:hypothetical protein